MNELELIPIENLLHKNFFIPSYQRGYRWKKRQVEDLLEDIFEFSNKEKEKGEFYCLQPIVVTKKQNGNWEVIDGQQRLTTLYIILSYLKEAREILFSSTEKFSISYETREKEEYSSKEFLENIRSITKVDDKNIDFYHISSAYLIIKDWFETKKVNKADFLNALLKVDVKDGNDIANNIRFIWYNVQTENEQEAKKIFTRINMGKIPLTNAELIKALFFINSNQTETEKEKHQSRIAYEWDNIENSLQNKSFWFFLNSTNNSKPTKIEFIFDLIANKYKGELSIEINKSQEKLYTFYVFNNLINNGVKTRAELWEEIKVYFRTFEEWYNNNEYYHLIGYLIHIGEKIEDLKLLSDKNSKSKFKAKLNKIISDKIGGYLETENLKLIELSYEDNESYIRDLLLLFNIISTKNSKYTKFPFERYINEKWSLEHIHAQNSENLKTNKQRILLLEEQRVYYQKLGDTNLLNEVDELLDSDELDIDLFVKLQEDIFKKYTEENNSNMHSLDNMALLAVGDNSSLSNNIFPIKRDKILELDEKGSFIPLCTKNVFMKYYSKDVSQNTTWTKKDREEYLTVIRKTLNNYLPDEERTN